MCTGISTDSELEGHLLVDQDLTLNADNVRNRGVFRFRSTLSSCAVVHRHLRQHPDKVVECLV